LLGGSLSSIKRNMVELRPKAKAHTIKDVYNEIIICGSVSIAEVLSIKIKKNEN
jgi:hypothetical protein